MTDIARFYEGPEGIGRVIAAPVTAGTAHALADRFAGVEVLYADGDRGTWTQPTGIRVDRDGLFIPLGDWVVVGRGGGIVGFTDDRFRAVFTPVDGGA